ncbi:MAG: sugar phosphate nucleotidyltransferase [Candidatus Nanohaloarchaea archaeon]
MKAIVLAGGHATRLWPITKDRAKPLLPLGDRPIIDFIVEDLEDEVDDIVISTNEKFADDFRKYIEDFERDARVVVENQDSEEEKPGTIGAMIQLIEQEDISDDLLIVNGDNYLGFSFPEMLDFCRERDGPVNVVYDLSSRSQASSFGVVDTEGDRIVGFEEKPDEPPSTLISTGVYYFPSHRVSLFHQYEEHFSGTDVPADQYLDEPGRLIEWAHEKTDMFAFSFDGDWFDIGSPEGYLDALQSVMDGNIVKGETSNCSIGENVLVLQDTVLEDVEIENSVVFPETEIRDSTIRNSLIDSHSEIEDADVNDAILGKHSSM